MTSFVKILLIITVVSGLIQGIIIMAIKIILQDKGKDVTFLYFEISDWKDFYKLQKKEKPYRVMFILCLSTFFLFIAGIVSIIVSLLEN